MTFEVIMKPGFGGPYYVDAEDCIEASKKGLARMRYHKTCMDNWPIEHCVAEVKICDKKAVQYA